MGRPNQLHSAEELYRHSGKHSSYIELASSLLEWGFYHHQLQVSGEPSGSHTWRPNWTTISGGGSARSQTVTGLTNNVPYIFSYVQSMAMGLVLRPVPPPPLFPVTRFPGLQ